MLPSQWTGKLSHHLFSFSLSLSLSLFFFYFKLFPRYRDCVLAVRRCTTSPWLGANNSFSVCPLSVCVHVCASRVRVYVFERIETASLFAFLLFLVFAAISEFLPKDNTSSVSVKQPSERTTNENNRAEDGNELSVRCGCDYNKGGGRGRPTILGCALFVKVKPNIGPTGYGRIFAL